METLFGDFKPRKTRSRKRARNNNSWFNLDTSPSESVFEDSDSSSLDLDSDFEQLNDRLDDIDQSLERIEKQINVDSVDYSAEGVGDVLEMSIIADSRENPYLNAIQEKHDEVNQHIKRSYESEGQEYNEPEILVSWGGEYDIDKQPIFYEVDDYEDEDGNEYLNER